MKLRTSAGVLMVSFSMISFFHPGVAWIFCGSLVVGVGLVGDDPLG